MHWIQRRRRRDLERRIGNGEVDLESLGIRRTRITQDAIDSLPTSIYTRCEELPNEAKARADDSRDVFPAQAESNASSADHSQWFQPTCPICLDDFILNSTTVRSLPCHHIYHPECIDPFLRGNSSLCPVCKSAVLSHTSAFIVLEPITNAMARHERRIRRMRQQEGRGLIGRSTSGGESEDRSWIEKFRYRLVRGTVTAPNGSLQPPITNQAEIRLTERRPVLSAAQDVNSAERARTSLIDAQTRREWIRSRIETLRGHDRTLLDAEVERSAGQSRCECYHSPFLNQS